MTRRAGRTHGPAAVLAAWLLAGWSAAAQADISTAEPTPPSANVTPARPALAAPWRAVVEHRVALPASRADPDPAAELSALAWDPLQEELVAVSDRGWRFRYRLQVRDGTLQARLLARDRLPPEVGDNAEGLAWRATSAQAGELLLAQETGGKVWRLGVEGGAPASLPWPATLAASVAAGDQHGVEAIAWHPRHGLLGATQRPAAAAAGRAGPRLHSLHAGHQVWRFEASGAGSHLKAIEVLADGSLLLLERTRAGSADAGLQTRLRWLDLARCGGEQRCMAPELNIDPPLPAGAENDEGLACTAQGLCWIVNDSGPGAVRHTRLVQFRLVAQ